MLGPLNDATSSETHLLHDLPKEGPPKVWEVKKGNAYTSPAIEGDFLVLSGLRGSNVFYIKVAVSNGGRNICILEVTYPRQVKIDFDAIVTRMSRSFAAGG